jgi:DNA-binding MarR family transcriptional regulator
VGSHIKGAAPADKNAAITVTLDSIRRIVRILRVSSRTAEKQVGLSAAQLFVLHTLGDQPALSLNELAERTRTHQSSVSVVVQKLVDRGMIEKAPVPGDGRRTALSITPAALPLLRDAPHAPTELLITALERMPQAARERLATSLARLVKELGADREPATMLFEDDAAAPAPPAGAEKNQPPGP